MGQDAVQPTAKRDTRSQTGKESSQALISLSVAKSHVVSTSWAQKVSAWAWVASSGANGEPSLSCLDPRLGFQKWKHIFSH